MTNVSLGRYVPYNSFIHRMDARNKIFCLIVLMVAVFISYPTYEITFIVGGALALAYSKTIAKPGSLDKE